MSDQNNNSNNIPEEVIKEAQKYADSISEDLEKQKESPVQNFGDINSTSSLKQGKETSASETVTIPIEQTPEDINNVVKIDSGAASTPVTDTNFVQHPQDQLSPTVVTIGNGGKTPFWFYLVFFMTLMIFIGVTTLLIKSFSENNQKTAGAKVITPTPQVTIANLSPTAWVGQADDSKKIEAAFMNLESADEVVDIEKDIKNTDFSPIDQSRNRLEEELY